jgi:hypothetical protein
MKKSSPIIFVSALFVMAIVVSVLAASYNYYAGDFQGGARPSTVSELGSDGGLSLGTTGLVGAGNAHINGAVNIGGVTSLTNGLNFITDGFSDGINFPQTSHVYEATLGGGVLNIFGNNGIIQSGDGGGTTFQDFMQMSTSPFRVSVGGLVFANGISNAPTQGTTNNGVGFYGNGAGITNTPLPPQALTNGQLNQVNLQGPVWNTNSENFWTANQGLNFYNYGNNSCTISENNNNQLKISSYAQMQLSAGGAGINVNTADTFTATTIQCNPTSGNGGIGSFCTIANISSVNAAGVTNTSGINWIGNITGTSGTYVLYNRGGAAGGTAAATAVWTNTILPTGASFILPANCGLQVVTGVGVTIQYIAF